MANEDETDDDTVTVLQDLRGEPSPGFFRRLRGSIERRVLGKQLLDMGFRSLVQVVLQYLEILLKVGAPRKGKNGEPHE